MVRHPKFSHGTFKLLTGDELVTTYSKLTLLRPDQVMPNAHMDEPDFPEQIPFASDDMPGVSVADIPQTQVDVPVPEDTEEGVTAMVHAASGPEVHDAAVASIATLQADQLVALLPPLVVDQDLCNNMRNQMLSRSAREQILTHQQDVWADDEVWWHLLSLPPLRDVILLDPLLASSWLTAGTVELVQSWISLHGSVHRIATVVLHDGHWIPCVWTVRLTSLDFHSWEHDNVDLNGLNALHGLLCRALGLTMFHVACTRRSFGLRHCGASAILFLFHRLCNQDLPAMEAELDFAAQSMRSGFLQAHAADSVMPRPWCWGAGSSDLPEVVASLLQSHGVPAGASSQRAKLVIQSLGRDAVQKAMHGVAPWKSLKHLANQHTPHVQLVLPDELNAVAQDRKMNKPSKGSKKQSRTRPVPNKPVDIDPARIAIADRTFCMGQDTPVLQIPIAQVGPLATGIALVTFSEAKPFLQEGSLLTQSGLALLVINGPDDLQTDLQWSSIRFAAKCLVNQQPVLLSGFLVQLGSQMIYPYTQPDACAVPDVPVACARITVHKDQWAQDWEEFAEQPFRNVLAALQPLQTCRVPHCTCDKWHPDEMDSASDVVLDVFRRQFFSDSGRPTKFSQAGHFSVQVRYLKCQEMKLLPLSGSHGLFIEPRTPDASAPSSDFQVVWMPQVDFPTVQHRSQCESQSLGLARSGRRFGIRVRAVDFQTLFAKLKPDGHFLAPGTRQTWHCGPWPYGSDRRSLAKVFKDLQWHARPLQPSKAVNGGIMWTIQSVDDPPSTVWNMKHGQVVVSKCLSMHDSVTDTSVVVGPQATVDLCTAQTLQRDPWLDRDPWQQAVKLTPAPVAAVANQLQELESRLEKTLLDKLPQDRMETDETENRIAVLEQQMQHLAHRHQALETTVTDNHKQNTAQVQSLQAQMLSQMEVQRSQMAGMFDDQMQKLEMILSKRSRTE